MEDISSKGTQTESGPGQGHLDETVLLVSGSPSHQNETENFELGSPGDQDPCRTKFELRASCLDGLLHIVPDSEAELRKF